MCTYNQRCDSAFDKGLCISSCYTLGIVLIHILLKRDISDYFSENLNLLLYEWFALSAASLSKRGSLILFI